MTIWLVLAFLGFGVFSAFIGFNIATGIHWVFLQDILGQYPDISLAEVLERMINNGNSHQ